MAVRQCNADAFISLTPLLVFVSTPLGRGMGRLEFRNAKELVLQLRSAASYCPGLGAQKSVNFWDENMSIYRSSNKWTYSNSTQENALIWHLRHELIQELPYIQCFVVVKLSSPRTTPRTPLKPSRNRAPGRVYNFFYSSDCTEAKYMIVLQLIFEAHVLGPRVRPHHVLYYICSTRACSYVDVGR